MQLEERVKVALQYEFGHTSPLNFVKKFFTQTFSPKQRESSHIKNWQMETESLVKNTLMFPLSTVFSPVYIAAAYLDRARKNMEEVDPKLVGLFPDEIHGHQWFKFIDPNVNGKELELVSNSLYQEIIFLMKTVVGDEEEPTADTEVHETELSEQPDNGHDESTDMM